MPRDARLLLAAARGHGGVSEDAAFRELARDVEDWAWVVGQAEEHGLGPMLCDRLTTVAADLIDPELAAAAQIYLATKRSVADAAALELAEVVDALSRAGIPTLPFKGPVLALQAYPDPALRPCRDLDILIRLEDRAATMAALSALGYAGKGTDLTPRRERDYYRYTGQDIVFASERLAVEPHWTLWPRVFCIDFEAPELWSRAGQVQSGNRSLPCPSPEDAMLIACIHGCKETWVRAVWIADVAGLITANPALDWDAILRRARGVQRMALLGADLAARLFNAPLPEMVRQRIAGDRSVGILSREVEAALFMPATGTRFVLARTQFRFRVRERWTDRLRYAGRIITMAQEGEFRSIDLPDPLSFLYPVVRVARLCHEHVLLPLGRLVRSRLS